ncbi:MAG: hypothetical protein ACT4N8_02930 [Sphingosinicella sp.]|uniref:hypothetical protein n=1 Tax=Sphingosinicella sp. TaxID=1917971 RepID=UPI004037D5E6
MMNEARPYASLSSGLLARKGAAKPAMRPQGYTGGFEDLGWNDMGHGPAEEEFTSEQPEHVPSSIAALTPLPKSGEPEVVAQQRAIAESFDEAEDEIEAVEAEAQLAPAPRSPAEIVKLPKRAQPVAVGKKAAFTLRLDAERHLRLRLACAVTGRSAQQLVAGALDAMLADIPEIEALAARVPAKGARKN